MRLREARSPSSLGMASARELYLAKRRVRKVAEGATINGTYRLSPEEALEAFRSDLLLILGD